MERIAVYKLKNPENTYVGNATIEEFKIEGYSIFSCCNESNDFHFMKDTLRGVKMSFASNYGRGNKIVWEKQ